MERDPVCGMEVKDFSKAESYNYKGKNLLFLHSFVQDTIRTRS